MPAPALRLPTPFLLVRLQRSEQTNTISRPYSSATSATSAPSASQSFQSLLPTCVWSQTLSFDASSIPLLPLSLDYGLLVYLSLYFSAHPSARPGTFLLLSAIAYLMSTFFLAQPSWPCWRTPSCAFFHCPISGSCRSPRSSAWCFVRYLEWVHCMLSLFLSS